MEEILKKSKNKMKEIKTKDFDRMFDETLTILSEKNPHHTDFQGEIF